MDRRERYSSVCPFSSPPCCSYVRKEPSDADRRERYSSVVHNYSIFFTFVSVNTTNRYFLEIAFDGRAYHGWQVQPNARTVQQEVDRVLGILLRQDISTVGCGRTDTGVHATQLYAHFDTNKALVPEEVPKFLYQLNALLPTDIAAKRLLAVAPQAHARFDATRRSYEYHLHFHKDPFLQGRSWLLRDIPDVAAMNAAAEILLQYEDFACFSKSHTQVHTHNCHITRAEWRWADGNQQNQLVFYISANRFLRNMVRAIVGTLLEIGRREHAPEYMRTVIQSKDRSVAGVSVPAEGLYLTEVTYPYL